MILIQFSGLFVWNKSEWLQPVGLKVVLDPNLVVWVSSPILQFHQWGSDLSCYSSVTLVREFKNLSPLFAVLFQCYQYPQDISLSYYQANHLKGFMKLFSRTILLLDRLSFRLLDYSDFRYCFSRREKLMKRKNFLCWCLYLRGHFNGKFFSEFWRVIS